MYTDTVEKLPGYPVQNSPSGSFLFLRGVCWQGWTSIWYCEKGMPQKDTLDNLRTPLLSYSNVVFHLSFNFLCLLLLYSIYICGSLNISCSELHAYTCTQISPPPPKIKKCTSHHPTAVISWYTHNGWFWGQLILSSSLSSEKSRDTLFRGGGRGRGRGGTRGRGGRGGRGSEGICEGNPSQSLLPPDWVYRPCRTFLFFACYVPPLNKQLIEQ